MRPPQALAGHPDRCRRTLAGAGRGCGGPADAGELRVERGAVYAGTGTVPVRLGDVQPQGKRRMPAADWARGLQAEPATHLGFS